MDGLVEALYGMDTTLLIGGGVAAGLVAVSMVVWRVFRRRPEPAAVEPEPAETAAATTTEVAPAPTGLAERLRAALARTRETLQARLDAVFRDRAVDDELFDELEEALLAADVGLPTATRLIAPIRERARTEGMEPDDMRAALKAGIQELLAPFDAALEPPETSPWVILVVGVNGSGKTTTIGKLAARFVAEGKRVMLAAGDTYRAAAADQLAVWAERAGADLVRQDEGADPASVVYTALESALARGHDVVIVDTAGRLQTRRPLMEQLSKMRRVIDKLVPGAPHETLLVLDGTMGQNGLSQARLFHEATPLTGVVVTKLDGTAKGGMILALAAEMSLPVKLVGIGEQIDDLRDFQAEAYVDALT